VLYGASGRGTVRGAASARAITGADALNAAIMVGPSFGGSALEMPSLRRRPGDSLFAQVEPPANDEVAIPKNLSLHSVLAVVQQVRRPRALVLAEYPQRLTGPRHNRGLEKWLKPGIIVCHGCGATTARSLRATSLGWGLVLIAVCVGRYGSADQLLSLLLLLPSAQHAEHADRNGPKSDGRVRLLANILDAVRRLDYRGDPGDKAA